MSDLAIQLISILDAALAGDYTPAQKAIIARVRAFVVINIK